eukprot:COSAG01_NODE_25175_length_753_cov_1.096330_1_plen_62_part_10
MRSIHILWFVVKPILRVSTHYAEDSIFVRSLVPLRSNLSALRYSAGHMLTHRGYLRIKYRIF